jgi:hypothetical protein
MFPQVSQLVRHLFRPLPNYAHSPSTVGSARFTSRVMISSIAADERNKRTLYTASCLIIGDEVLGGKASDS